MKSALELNKLLFKFALLYHVETMRQCQIQPSKDNLGEENILKSVSFKLSKSLKYKFCQTWCHLSDKLDLLQKSHFELLGGWLHCLSHDSLLFVFCIFIYNVSTFIFYLQILDFYSNICSNSNKNFYNNNR